MKNFVLGLCFAIISCFGSSAFAGDNSAGSVTNNTPYPLLGWTDGPDGPYFPIPPGTTVGNGQGGIADVDYYFDPVSQQWRKVRPEDCIPSGFWPQVQVDYLPPGIIVPAQTSHRYVLLGSPTESTPSVVLPLQGPGLNGYFPGTPPTWGPPQGPPSYPIPHDLLPLLCPVDSIL
jgi:hypothetical protein